MKTNSRLKAPLADTHPPVIRELSQLLKTFEQKTAHLNQIILQLHENEILLRTALENSQEGIFVIDGNFKFLYANKELCQILARPINQIVGCNFTDFLSDSSKQKVIDAYLSRRQGKSISKQYEFSIKRENGEKRRVVIRAATASIPGKDMVTIGQILDITGSRKTEEALRASEEKSSNIIENIEEGYFEINLKGDFTFFNQSVCATMGYSRNDLLGMNYTTYTSPRTAQKMFRIFNQVFLTGKPAKVTDYEIIRKDGTPLVLELSTYLIRDHDGTATGFRGITRDASERKQYEEKLAYLAYHDSLTGLYNRKAFLEKLEELLQYAARYRTVCAILFVDLDRFKQVNDTFGHHIGDLLLQQVAIRLKKLLRKTDHVCRHGGDEFTIILSNASDTYPQKVAQRVLEKMSAPFLIEGCTIDFLTTSIGIGIYPEHGRDVNHLMHHADKAMYRAKQEGNRYVV